MRFKILHRSICLTFFALLLVFTTSLVGTQENIGSTYIEIKEISKIYDTKMEYQYSDNKITLKTNENYGKEISVNEDGYIALINGTDVAYLPSKIYHKDSVLYTPIEIASVIEDDTFDDTYEEVDFNPFLDMNTNFKYVIIDPGHGGKDPGATSGTTYEKDIVLELAFKLKEEIIGRNKDLIVILTRTDDVELDPSKSKDLRKRAEIGSRYSKLGSGVFISLHVNATPIEEKKEKVRGIETWYYYPSSDDKKYSSTVLAYRKEWINKVYNEKLTEKNINNMNLSIGKSSMKFAKKVHNSLHGKVKNYTYNRGIKKGIFQVLRESVIPAILCEVGFVSNAEEKNLLTSDSYQIKIVQGLADGIINYIDSEYPVLSSCNSW